MRIVLALLLAAFLPLAAHAADPVRVEPTSIMKPCTTDGDCEIVDATCEPCCQYDSVNRRQLQAYQMSKTGVCATAQHGQQCDCMACPDKEEKPVARCMQGICQSRCEKTQ